MGFGNTCHILWQTAETWLTDSSMYSLVCGVWRGHSLTIPSTLITVTMSLSSPSYISLPSQSPCLYHPLAIPHSHHVSIIPQLSLPPPSQSPCLSQQLDHKLHLLQKEDYWTNLWLQTHKKTHILHSSTHPLTHMHVHVHRQTCTGMELKMISFTVICCAMKVKDFPKNYISL